MQSFIAGFSLGFSLILAIGAQNAFVLKQGLIRQHVFLVCLLCALSDALLIALGVSGFSAIIERFPTIETVARFGGAAFLSVYAMKSFYHALTRNQILNPAEQSNTSAVSIILTCLALTWLNPHVYLDTVFLLGAVSTKYVSTILFGFGAIIASFIFFFSLGFGARLLSPLFAKPSAWKFLDALIGLIMLSIVFSLIL